jgi:hypothetical protein
MARHGGESGVHESNDSICVGDDYAVGRPRDGIGQFDPVIRTTFQAH